MASERNSMGESPGKHLSFAEQNERITFPRRKDAESELKVIEKHEVGGAISGYTHLADIQEISQKLRAKAVFETSELDMLQRQNELDRLTANVQEIDRDIKTMSSRITELQQQLAAADTIQGVQRRTMKADLARTLSANQKEFSAKLAQLHSAKQEFDAKESALSKRKVAHSRLKNESDSVMNTQIVLFQERSVITKELTARRKQAETRRGLERERQENATQAKIKTGQEQAKKEQDIVTVLNRKAINRLAKTHKAIHQAQTAIEGKQQIRKQHFVEGVLKLKNDIEKSGAMMRSRTANRDKQIQQEKQSIVEGNTDGIVRHRLQERMLARKKGQDLADATLREMEIMARINEQHRQDSAQEAKRHEKALVAVAESASNRVDDERLTRAMKEDAVLVPGVYPSELAVVKTASFGTGRATDRVVEAVMARHPGVELEVEGLIRKASSMEGLPKPGADQVKKVEEAVARRHDRILNGTAKRICGKSYPGPYFLANPQSIEFIDVGSSVMRSRVSITNVSFGDNTFRLVGIPDPLYAELFEIVYDRPGKMSAGITVIVTIIFRPPIDSITDIRTRIDFLAETGPFSIPLVALVRKTSIALLTPSVLEFSTVIHGQSSVIPIAFANNGAIPASFHSILKQGREEEWTIPPPGTISPYSQATIKLEYRPSAPDRNDTGQVLVVFDNDGGQWGSPSEIAVELHGDSCQVPIYIDSPVLDYECCIIGEQYRQSIQVRNRSSQLVKVVCVVDRHARPLIRARPRSVFVHGASSSQIQLSFNPSSRDLFDRFLTTGSTDLIEIPIRLEMANQDAINAVIRARLTSGDLIVEPVAMQFGECAIGSRTWLPMTVRNPSLVVQRCGVLSPSYQVAVDPPLFHILPGSQQQVRVVYRALECSAVSIPIKLRSGLGREVTIECHGSGRAAPLRCSPAVLHLPPVALGLDQVATCTITNTTNTDYQYQMTEPDKASSHLSLIPSGGRIGPGQSRQVDIVFQPVSAGDDGATVAKDGVYRAQHTIPIWARSTSQFPLPIFVQVDRILVPNHSGRVPVLISPSSGDLSPQASVGVPISLRPDRAHPGYGATVRLTLTDDRPARLYEVVARSWPRQLYVLSPSALIQHDHDMFNPILSPITVALQKSDTNSSIVGYFFVGSCSISSPLMKGTPGSYDLQLSESTKKTGCLRVSPSSGTLSAQGEQVRIELSFDCGKWTTIEPTGIIRHIRESITCVLKGGFVPVTTPDIEKTEIICNIHL